MHWEAMSGGSSWRNTGDISDRTQYIIHHLLCEFTSTARERASAKKQLLPFVPKNTCTVSSTRTEDNNSTQQRHQVLKDVTKDSNIKASFLNLTPL